MADADVEQRLANLERAVRLQDAQVKALEKALAILRHAKGKPVSPSNARVREVIARMRAYQSNHSFLVHQWADELEAALLGQAKDMRGVWKVFDGIFDKFDKTMDDLFK
jgi:uncharacterized coiled-coil protein SlyX